MIKYYNSLKRLRVIVRLSALSVPGDSGGGGANSEPCRRLRSEVSAHPVQRKETRVNPCELLLARGFAVDVTARPLQRKYQ